MGNRVTLKELSEYCNVSIATVSRVLNNTGRFSQQTKDLVNNAAEKLGYIPNTMGKFLRKQSSRLVSIFVNRLDYETTSVTVTQLQELLEQRGYSCLIANIGVYAEKEQSCYQTMMSLNVCAIFMMVNVTSGYVMQHASLPVVFLYRYPFHSNQAFPENMCVIETDDFAAGYAAGTELLRIGCSRIAEVRLKSINGKVPLGRHLGLLQALYDNHVDYDESFSAVCNENQFGTANQQLLKLFEKGIVADGYFCTSDLLALALIRALETHHYHVPEHVKVIGCNDMSIAMHNPKPITSIRHRISDICFAATEMMERMLSGEVLSENERKITFSVDLIRRETT